jgi:hypothetical protein
LAWGACRLVLVVAAGLAGCAQVDPKPDYARVSQLVAERPGLTEMYDPCGDELVGFWQSVTPDQR